MSLPFLDSLVNQMLTKEIKDTKVARAVVTEVVSNKVVVVDGSKCSWT